MRIITLFISLMISTSVMADQSRDSYATMLEQYLHESKQSQSPFTADDLNVMQKAGKDLTPLMPEPGLKPGTLAPGFKLQNAFGKSVSLADMLKQGAVVLVFYRGAWCPFCNLHLRALQAKVAEFKSLGASLVLVTPQTPDKSAEQLKQGGYQFEVLSDLNSEVMKSYNLYFELPDELIKVYKKHKLDIEAFNGKGRAVLPVPGTFVIDKGGVIRAMHADTDYKQRMEPEDIIKALKDLAQNSVRE